MNTYKILQWKNLLVVAYKFSKLPEISCLQVMKSESTIIPYLMLDMLHSYISGLDSSQISAGKRWILKIDDRKKKSTYRQKKKTLTWWSD